MSRLRPIVVVLLVAPAVIGLMSAMQSWVLIPAAQQRVPFAAIASYNVASWYLWAALAPLVIAAGRRVPVDATTWRRSVPFHLVVGALVALVHAATSSVFVWLGIRRYEDEAFLTLLRGSTFIRFHIELLLYWAILGAGLALDYQRKYRDRAVQANALAAELAQARLRALKMQLHPHFLFNTLHAITVLVDEDPPAARRMVARLGELLRHTLASGANGGADDVPLGAELEFLRLYLEIEETRFQDRLRVTYDVSPDAAAARVPDLILQPLVENAVKHAVSARTAPVHVAVRARRVGDRLELRVEDDGPGLAGATPRDGIGLATTRERLARLYGDGGRLTLGAGPGGIGTSVTVAMPFREATAG